LAELTPSPVGILLALDIHPQNRCERCAQFPRSFKESLKQGEGAHHME